MLTVAAPMAGLGPEDVTVEVTADGHLLLDGRLRPEPKVDGVALDAGKTILLDEWTILPYHREIVLDVPVDGPRIGAGSCAICGEPAPLRGPNGTSPREPRAAW